MSMTDQEREDARQIFEGKIEGKSACRLCAGIHAMVAGLAPEQQPCPRVKRLEYAATGQVLSVEFWPWNGNWEVNVIFPQDAYEDNETA